MGLFDVREIVASAARTVTGQSGTVRVDTATRKIALLLDVTAQSGGTPTLDVTVEWSSDGGVTWFTGDVADAFTQVTTTLKKVARLFDVKAPHYRIVWTIAGSTPSYTFAVDEYQS